MKQKKKQSSTNSRISDKQQLDLFTELNKIVEKFNHLGIRAKLPSSPEEGVERFFVANKRYGIYTSIGADNIHHAGNKATKLFGPNWDFIRQLHHTKDLDDYQHTTVAMFNKIINS